MAGSFESWLEKVLDSIFEEGVNSATLNFMNYVFYALFAVLTTLFLGSGLNLHVLALLLLSIALCLATNWCVCTTLISGLYLSCIGNPCGKRKKIHQNQHLSQIPSLNSHGLVANNPHDGSLVPGCKKHTCC